MQVIWRMWHQNWNIKLDWTAFTDKGTLPQELEFHELASAPGNSVNNLLDWLTEAWTQQWQVVNEVKNAKNSLVYRRRNPKPQWDGNVGPDLLGPTYSATPILILASKRTRGHTLHQDIRKLRQSLTRWEDIFWWGSGYPAYLRSSVVAILYTPLEIGGYATMELCSLVSVEMMGSLNSRRQMVAFASTDKVSTVTTISHKGQVVIRGFRFTGLWRII